MVQINIYNNAAHIDMCNALYETEKEATEEILKYAISDFPFLEYTYTILNDGVEVFQGNTDDIRNIIYDNFTDIIKFNKTEKMKETINSCTNMCASTDSHVNEYVATQQLSASMRERLNMIEPMHVTVDILENTNPSEHTAL